MSSNDTFDALSRAMARRASRRTAIKGGAALASAGVISGAALSSSSGVAAQDGANITFWFDTTGGAETAQCLIDNIVNPFNAQGGTQVEATMQPNGWTATQTALAGGAGPDIVVTPGPTYVMELAKAGQLLNLDEAAAAHGWDQTVLPWALDLGRVDGSIYSIPHEVESLVLWYNATLFDEHGWEVPNTMDELITLSQAVQDAGLIPFAHGNQEWRPANEWFVGEWLNQLAGPDLVYAALTGEAQWTDPAFVDAISKLNDMQQNGWFYGGLDRYYTGASADTASSLAYGDSAMKIEGTWFFSDAMMFFEESGQEWGWAPFPSTDGTDIFDLGIGSTYSINARTAAPEASAEFLNYWFSPEAQGIAVSVCGMGPAPVSIPEELLEGIDARQAAMINAVADASAAGNYGYTTWTFFPPKTITFLIENIERVWAGDLSVEDFLAEMQSVFDPELAAGDVPPLPARS
ncbi:MAG: extracellular solute-binding protein [Thermomicrobiales bacterium]|nr:extracellular solute-binding protein [Thermomicrobiales bacterium]